MCKAKGNKLNSYVILRATPAVGNQRSRTSTHLPSKHKSPLACCQEREVAEHSVKVTVALLQQLVHRLEAGPQASHSSRSACKFPAALQIAMHLLLPHLRNQHMVASMLEMTASVTFPGLRLPGLRKQIPSESHIRKRQICLDASWMMVQRDFQHGKKARWVWADSSPQADWDWMQVKEKAVREVDLLDVSAAITHLATANAEGELPCLEDLEAWNSVIERSFTIHMRIPTPKASGLLEELRL